MGRTCGEPDEIELTATHALLNGCAQAHHLGEQAQRLWSVNERDTLNELRGGVEDIEQTAWGRGRLS